jgi:hypothetical protein
MNAITPEIQRIEHKKRMLEEKLKVKQSAIHSLEREAGELRCEIQKEDNDLYGLLTRRQAV